jgi:hypothetical protein
MYPVGVFLCRFILLFFFGLGVLTGCSDDGSSASDPPSVVEPVPPSGPVPIVSPVRITGFDESTFLVADAGANALSLVSSSTLQPMDSLRLNGKPTAVAYSDGLFFFGNRYNRSVDVLDAEGNFLYYLGGRAVLFKQINDLAIDGSKKIIYALDTQSALIKSFNFDGSSAGSDIGEGTLEHPTALTVDPINGDILVSDFGEPSDPQVWIFNSSGALVDSIVGKTGGWFNPQLAFSTPQGLFVDSTNHLYLTDALSGEIKIYSLQNNELVKTLGTVGTGPEQLYYPLDVYVDDVSRDVYVSDNRNGRITVFPGGGVIQ